ncbi:CHAD domain-containing protein [Rugosimonospora africana]|uniref:CHAD domain-containing protein n=1 Tax=Rugosimonospora africana TaxID=556532 RepID=A0A8J3QV05_9ACTN|nr:CHAD domain-containing protein [Rugosimonospora africana]GIH16310.1 hypothetical protein Raf01_44820 [Rugosimonospora africana]
MATTIEIERKNRRPKDFTPARDASEPARTLGAKWQEPGRRPEPAGTGNAGAALIHYLTRQRDAILSTDPGVRAGDPHAVHDMRVATRRLRATLRTFRPVLQRDDRLPRDDLRRLGEELRWLGTTLGAVRDGDVLARRLDDAVAAQVAESVVGPVRARIRERLGTRRRQARDDLAEALDSERYGQLLDRLGALADAASVPVTRARLRRLTGKAVRRAERRLAAANRVRPGRTGTGPLRPPPADNHDVALHEARKAYKRARYAAEALVPVEGRPARRPRPSACRRCRTRSAPTRTRSSPVS